MIGDGIALAFWLNGSDSDGCCTFRGGAYTESRFFGEGVGIAVKSGNETLVRALNHALYRLWERGVFTDLYLRRQLFLWPEKIIQTAKAYDRTQRFTKVQHQAREAVKVERLWAIRESAFRIRVDLYH